MSATSFRRGTITYRGLTIEVRRQSQRQRKRFRSFWRYYLLRKDGTRKEVPKSRYPWLERYVAVCDPCGSYYRPACPDCKGLGIVNVATERRQIRAERTAISRP